ncbi:integral membrane protein [Colletotrichum kahawae]|uniref:Integral membrane protein n=1 Tax=Colletotrichum kahawae TaxID=34407 RepID=A0AAD9YC75_COLKA|nr:integral membrane protein [Colletotrichum kahawae]
MGWTYGAPDDTPTDGPRITAVTTTFTSIALILVCLRWYVRTTVVKAVGKAWSMRIYCLQCNSFVTVGNTVLPLKLTETETKWGLGIHVIEDMPTENILHFGRLQFIGGPFYVLGIWGFKMSLLFSYLRFFPQGAYRIATIIVAVVVTMGHIAFICVFIFLCTPVEKQYDPSIPPEVGHCVDAITFYLTFSSLTIVFDVIIMFLPFPVILKSQIQQRKKVVLLALFILGVFVTIIQAIRIQTIKNLVNYLDSAKSIEWSVIENDIGIIIACVPTLAPLVKYFAEKSRSSTAGASRTKNSKYALQTWRTGRSGMQPLSAGVDRHASISATRTTKPDDSTENILVQEPSGITKTTDIQVSTQDGWSDLEDKNSNHRV